MGIKPRDKGFDALRKVFFEKDLDRRRQLPYNVDRLQVSSVYFMTIDIIETCSRQIYFILICLKLTEKLHLEC